MSNERYGGGLVWSPLFSITKEERDKFLKNYKQWYRGNENLASFVYQALNSHGYDYADNDTAEAVKIALLKQLILHTNFASDILSEEEYKKATDTFKRGQYNNNILKQLIGYFLCAWNHLVNKDDKPVCMDNGHFYFLLYSDIESQLSLIKEKQVEKDYAPLKKVIEKIASGVKADCYLIVTKKDPYLNFSKLNLNKKQFESPLNEYIKNKYNYDFNTASAGTNYVFSENFGNSVNEILQQSLVNDKKFWKDKEFCVVDFLNKVFKKNSEKHAQKIIDYIFKSFEENENIMKLIENDMSIGFSNIEIFKKKFSDHALFKNINKELYYPLFEIENESEKIRKGKEVFERFLYEYVYPSSKDKVKERLSQNLKLGTHYTIFGALNFNVLNYNMVGEESKALNLLMPDFFTVESMWKRVYLKAYYFSIEAPSGKLNDYLFNCFYNLFELLYEDLSVETSVQLDMESRHASYRMLKNMLKRNNVNISTIKSGDYIASLMDRKSATLKEADRFPVLEQLGDAIYGFAVAEMIFYNPYYNDYMENAESPQKRFEDYTQALTQIKIAKRLKIDEMYVSASSVLCKYDYNCLKNTYIDFEEISRHDDKEKYLADSLEMILGAVALDLGYNESIKLAKKFICETFPDDFKEEVHYNYENVMNQNIDKDYFRRILPGLYSDFEGEEDSISRDYNQVMHDALYKLLGCLILKTDNIDTRKFISYSLYKVAELFDDHMYFYEVLPSYYCYLNEGLDVVIDNYKNDALKKYNEKK